MARCRVRRRRACIVERPGLTGPARSCGGRSGRPRRAGGGPRPSSSRTTQSNASSKASGRSSTVEPGPISARCSRRAPRVDARGARGPARPVRPRGALRHSGARRRRRPRRARSCWAWPKASFPPDGSRALRCSPSPSVARSGRRCAARRGRRDERRTYLAALACRARRGGCSIPVRAASASLIHRRGSPARCRRAERLVESFDAELARSARSARLAARARPPRAASVAAGSPRGASARRGETRSSRVASPRSQARIGDAFCEWEGNVGSPRRARDRRHGAVRDRARDVGGAAPRTTCSGTCCGVREQDDVADVDELEAAAPRHARPRGARAARPRAPRRRAADQLALPFESEVSVDASRRATRSSEWPTRCSPSSSWWVPRPYPILWDVEKRRIVRDVVRTLASDEPATRAARRRASLRRDEQPPFTLTLPSGRVLSVHGAIDRVDRLHDRLRVIDYKTGQRREPRRTSWPASGPGRCCSSRSTGSPRKPSSTPHAPVSAGYWYVSSKGGWKYVSIPIDGEVKERFLATLDTISTRHRRRHLPREPR